MTIRAAAVGDAKVLAVLHVRSVRELAAGHYSHEQIKAWVKGIESKNYLGPIAEGRMLVAEAQDGRLAGFAIYEPESCRLGLLYVSPDFARQGVGRLLVQAVEVEARSTGARRVWLDSSLNALRFYEKLGFTEIERTTNEWQGVRFPRIKMEKLLP